MNLIENQNFFQSPKVVHVCTADSGGGAALAALRLCKEQRKIGIDASMLVLHASSSDACVTQFIQDNKTFKYYRKFLFLKEVALSFTSVFSRAPYKLFSVSIPYSGVDISKHPLIQQADIIHLHWINQGFLSLESLKSIASLKKKCVWTLHDMWPIVSICHNTNRLDDLFYLDTPFSKNLISSFWAERVYNQKRKLYSLLRPTFVGCSNWITKRALASPLSQYGPVKQIPNVADYDSYKVHIKKDARDILKLSQNKKIILFGAANVKDYRKGYDLFRDSINLLAKYYDSSSSKPLILFFGKADEHQIRKDFPLWDVDLLGYIKDAETMALYYSAADLFVTTSREENLPNTIVESHLCNCPVVAFSVGGIPEMIQSSIEGKLVSPFDVNAMADAIYTQLKNENVEANIRDIVEKRYNKERILSLYQSVYNGIDS